MEGSFDKAISLNGSGQYIDVPDAVWLNGSFTVESWVYVRSHRNYARLMDFGNGPTQNVVLCALSQGESGRPLFEIYNGITSGGIVTAPSPLPLNTWTHLAFTFGAGTGKIFVNNVEVASGPMSSPANVTRTNNFIGKSNWLADSYANAIFDEFRLWNTART